MANDWYPSELAAECPIRGRGRLSLTGAGCFGLKCAGFDFAALPLRILYPHFYLIPPCYNIPVPLPDSGEWLALSRGGKGLDGDTLPLISRIIQ